MTHKQFAAEFFLTRRIFFFLTELTDVTELSTSVSNPQNAFGIQISQNVTAIFNTNKVQHEAYIQPIGVSR